MRLRIAAPERNRDTDDTKSNERRTSTGNQVAVGPASVSGSRAAAMSGIADAGGDESVSNRLGRGEEIRGTRPYVAGDDLRTVHWKSTARLGRLVVKEFHPITRSEAVIIWDGAGQATRAGRTRRRATKGSAAKRQGTPPVRDDATENSLRLTMSLCRTLAERGQPCTLLRLDKHPTCVSSQSRAATEYSMASYSGGEGAGSSSAQNSFQLRCSEVLADASADRDTPLAEALGSQLTRVDVGGDVYVVTASLSPDVAHTVSLLQRRGSRLAVGLVDTSQTSTGRAGQESLRVAPFSFNASRDDTARAASNYGEQAHRLRAAGARVVQLRLGTNRAQDAASQDATSPEKESTGVVYDVRTALSHLLDAHFSGRVSNGYSAYEYSTESGTSEPAPNAAGNGTL
jgi:uncharacterized protein (DUF58 family)